MIIHHQAENFAAGMPADLAFKFAARQVIFAFLEHQRGEGWSGSEQMADYYPQQSLGDDPFNWIKVYPLMTPETMAGFPFDYAGQGETSLLMALFPEAIDLAQLSAETGIRVWRSAAWAELGPEGRDRILARLRKMLSSAHLRSEVRSAIHRS